MSLLNMSFSGSVFIMAIVLIRAITINRLPKKTFLILWMLALLRLLLPFSIPSVFSVYTLISADVSTPENSVVETGDTVWDAQMENPIVAMQGTEPLQPEIQLPVSLLSIVWCVGMSALAIFFIISYLHCLREFQTALPVHDPYAEQWLREHSRKRQLLLRQSDEILAPLTYGIFRPVILMPKNTDWENRKELQFILTHEYVHVCRFDAVTKLILSAALCIHWFNPFVWVMYFLFNRDIELACDESVLGLLGTQSKADYSLMLINMETRKSGLSPLCNNFCKNAIEERITAIMKTKKTTIFSLLTACLIVLGATAVFATSAQTTNLASSETQESTTDGEASESPVSASDFTEYANFGLKWDDSGKVLYYDGKRVRYFFDGADLGDGNGQAVKLEYADGSWEGETDVYTVRQRIDNGDGSVDLMGPLVGLAEYSQKEFDERMLLPASLSAEAGDTVALGNTSDETGEIEAVTEETAAVVDYTDDEADVVYEGSVAEGTGSGGTTFADIFEKYKAYGITYVESGGERNVYYNGSLVHHFADITPDGGAFSFTSSKEGGINIKTIYDHGKLCGVEQMER